MGRVPFGSGCLAAALRKARHESGLSQHAVARHVKMHETAISFAERGQRNICDDRLIEIEIYLGCRPGLLVEAAQADRRGLFFPATQDAKDGVLVDLFLDWQKLPAARAEDLRRCFRSMLKTA